MGMAIAIATLLVFLIRWRFGDGVLLGLGCQVDTDGE
jgi:hypothetical protein